MTLRKNVASQKLVFTLLDVTTGGVKTGATVTAKLSIDGGSSATASGSVAELANGQYCWSPAQADTNGTSLGVQFTATGAIPVAFTIYTIGQDPTLSTLDVNILKLLGTAWLTPGTAGTPDVNVKLWNALTTVALPLVPTTAGRTLDVTAANKVNGVVLVDTVTTYTGNTPQTGDNFARLGAPAGASVSADVAAIQAKTVNLPAAPASTTNITAGTITTVTNLTNAPTAGDFTAAMKTSLNAATPASVVGAVGSVTGNLGGNVVGTIGSLAAQAKTDVENANWDAVMASHVAAGSTGATLNAIGAPPSAATIATAVWGNATRLLTAGTNIVLAKGVGLTGLNDIAQSAILSDATPFPGADIDAAISSRLATASYTAPPSAATNASTLLGSVVEGAVTVVQSLRLANSANGAQLSGAATATVKIRDLADSKDRVTATVDSDGNRVSVTRDLT